MKWLNLLYGLTLLTTISCQSQNTFEYKGERPKDTFIILDVDESESDFVAYDAKDISLNNRIYVMLDSNNTIQLNGHIIPQDRFKQHFEYIITNTDRHPYLPSKVEEAVIFTNFMVILEDTSSVQKNIVRSVQRDWNRVLKNIITAFIEDSLHTTLETIKPDDLDMVRSKFIPRMAHLEQKSNSPSVKLPPWADESYTNLKPQKRNIFNVVVSSKNSITIRDEEVVIEDVKRMTKTFISNPNRRDDLAESPKKAIISLKNERGTKYETYIEVYNELKAAYNELWDAKAQELFQKPYEELDMTEKKQIRRVIPFIISEAEPTTFGEG